MHLVLPFASLAGPAAEAALQILKLPTLERLLRQMAELPPAAQPAVDEADEFSLSPPHEHLLAGLRGWPQQDGLLPFAAEWARADGLVDQVAQSQSTQLGWALISPCHWHLGTEQVSLTNPADLSLDESQSRQLFAAVEQLFCDDGWALHWGAPSRWYATHPSLAQVRSASLDRVVGRNVDWWLNEHPQQRQALRLTRRLQAEVQMLLHGHPLNAKREAQGLRPVNSIWLSGTGPTQRPAAPIDASLGLRVDDRLRAPALAGDWRAWAAAWAELDAGPLAEFEAALNGPMNNAPNAAQNADQPGASQPMALSLCGERRSITLIPAAPTGWQRLLGQRLGVSLGKLLSKVLGNSTSGGQARMAALLASL